LQAPQTSPEGGLFEIYQSDVGNEKAQVDFRIRLSEILPELRQVALGNLHSKRSHAQELLAVSKLCDGKVTVER
jgi:hypothetical protein